ncbi:MULTISPECIES: TraR/DksA C4-type zinc finger protein [Streptomyces]|jgi:DnaK suppressor protein|uniref:TraR/DksA C4-type zinc finger protein n=1 Tax=Streptomyces TaxID=1883 RepID=UPI00082F1FB1|nr:MULTISPECIES: TraR/DksA C4-type zinc finger protein [Streptomyces]MDN5384917.1 TraR/DksA C4-type zinc finger protein [Streptomyces sp. LB8]
MSLDAARTAPRLERAAAEEARRRLEHARGTRLVQLEALGETGQAADDHLMSSQREAIERVLQEIDEAFARIEDGTYGICRGCDKPIPAERLEILPYTAHCVPCLRRIA